MAASELTTAVLAGPGVGTDVWVVTRAGQGSTAHKICASPPQKEIWPHTSMEFILQKASRILEDSKLNQ